ncbi:MAG: hypothetical protein AAFQ40_04290 [Cyanobacteria bacterium J06623_5]
MTTLKNNVQFSVELADSALTQIAGGKTADSNSAEANAKGFFKFKKKKFFHHYYH